jgi:C1A family cysteine protease
MAKLKHTDLVNALTAAKARWRAAETPVSLLSEAKQKALLGAVPSAEVAATMAALAAAPPQAPSPTFAPAVDWRNKNGNHVSGVRNQGGCGSCVSFACVATVESMGHIERGVWVDLSEADSHFCSSHGANCGGWWPDQCLDQIKSRGVCDEACFPYATAFPNNDIWSGPPVCKLCPDRNSRAVKITNRVQLSDPTAAKNHLSSIGPVAGCIDVYQDFFSYNGGVYHHVSGSLAGGHCMEVIGYSEAEQCWIVKNSWDTTWGVGGFGKIAYSDLKFNGQFYPMYGATGVVLPAVGFQSLGGVLTSRVAVGRNKDGRLEVFGLGTDNALWHIWQLTPNGSWSGWASLGGVLAGDPCVVANADGRLEVFARGANNALLHIWQTAPNDGWSAWASLAGIITSDPSAGRNLDGRLEVFARGADGALWHIWQTAPNDGWSGWGTLGVRFIGDPVVANNKDGRLEVFFCGLKNDLLHIWQTAPNNGWSGWASLGGVLTSEPAVARNKDGRLEVFVRGTDAACWHVWQTAPNNGWSGWASRGGILSDGPAVASNADGRLEVFARGTALNLIHTWQTAPNDGWN